MALSAPINRSTAASAADGTSLALNTSGVTTGVVALISIVAVGGATVDPGAISIDNGFTKYNEFTEASARIALFWKVITGSESSVTASWPTSGKATAVVMECPGASTLTPLERWFGLNNAASSVNHVTGSGAATVVDRWALALHWSRSTTDGTQVFTPDAALTEIADLTTSAGGSPWATLEVSHSNAAIGDLAAHQYTSVGLNAQSHGGGVLVYLIDAGSAIDQKAFRFGLDDASESAHTFPVAENTDVTLAVNDTRLLRILIDETNGNGRVLVNPTWQYRQVGDPEIEWRDIKP